MPTLLIVTVTIDVLLVAYLSYLIVRECRAAIADHKEYERARSASSSRMEGSSDDAA